MSADYTQQFIKIQKSQSFITDITSNCSRACFYPYKCNLPANIPDFYALVKNR